MKSRLISALCALVLPTAAVAQPASEPQYERVYDDYNAAVFTTGAVLFTASYGASAIAAAKASDENHERGFDQLYLPVVGPWLALDDYDDCPLTRLSCDEDTTTKVLLIADGVFQAAGVLAMLDGMLEPSSHLVPVRTAKSEKIDTKVRITPATVKGNPGIALVGRF